MIIVRVTTLILLAALAGACSESSEGPDQGSGAGAAADSGQEQDSGAGAQGTAARLMAEEAKLYPPGKSGPTLKVFPEEGPIALEIDGVPVPAKTIERYIAIYKIRLPGSSEKTVRRQAIEEGIIPVAALYSKNRADLGVLSERAWQAWNRLERGEQWNTVVVDAGDDPNAVANFGSQGIRRRLGVAGLSPLHAIEEEEAFACSDDGHSKPFVTPLGVLVVRAAKPTRLPGQSDAEVQREVFRILFAWDPEYRGLLGSFDVNMSDAEKEAFGRQLRTKKERMKRQIKAAKVKVLDESYRGVIYGSRLKKS